MAKIFDRHTLQRKELLKSRKAIAELFQSGSRIYHHPVLLYYKITDYERPSPVRVAFSVSKRKWAKASKRNRIKRLLREAYRINKHSLLNAAEARTIGIHLMLLYVSEKEISFEQVSRQVANSLAELQNTVDIP